MPRAAQAWRSRWDLPSVAAARYYNTTVLIDATGEMLLRYRKTHLWASDEGVFTPAIASRSANGMA